MFWDVLSAIRSQKSWDSDSRGARVCIRNWCEQLSRVKTTRIKLCINICIQWWTKVTMRNRWYLEVDFSPHSNISCRGCTKRGRSLVAPFPSLNRWLLSKCKSLKWKRFTTNTPRFQFLFRFKIGVWSKRPIAVIFRVYFDCTVMYPRQQSEETHSAP